jgi:2-keto-4-pentenoate hydratase
MTTVDVHGISATLERARLSARPVAPLGQSWPALTLADAYAVQEAGIAGRLAGGARVRGHKVGLTSRAMQEMLGVDAPDSGVLLEDMLVPDGGQLELARLVAPRVEVETAFVLRDRLAGPGLTVDDVLDATDHVRTALEVIDSRIADWRITLLDTVADNASCAAVVLGERQVGTARGRPGRGRGPPRARARRAGAGARIGCPRAPGPRDQLAGRAARERGQALEPGQVVLPGACTRAVPVTAGDTVTGEVDGLGAVSVRFA